MYRIDLARKRSTNVILFDLNSKVFEFINSLVVDLNNEFMKV